MSVLSLHIEDGVLEAVKTNDEALVGLEVIAVIEGSPVRSVRVSLEVEIIRYVGQAREKSAIDLAERAFAQLLAHCQGRSFESFDEAAAAWGAAKSEMDRRIGLAWGLVYGSNSAKYSYQEAAE